MGLFDFDKTAIEVCNLGEEGTDLEFWLSRTPQERVSTVEYLRQMMYGYDPLTARMERVLEIVDLK